MKSWDTTVVIRASAGTGKTFQLTNRFLKLIKDGVQPEHILAVTFTRMAAGEILERVLLRLSNAALSSQKCDELSEQLNDRSFTRERCLNLLQELTRNLHRLRIETLDAYFAQLARSFSLEIGLPPNWEIVEDAKNQRWSNEALEETIRDDGDKTISRLMRILFQGEAQRSVNWQLRDAVSNLYSVYQETEPAAWRNFPELDPLEKEELKLAVEAMKSIEAPSHKTIERMKVENEEAAETGNWELFVSRGITPRIVRGETSYYKKEFSADLILAYQKLITHAQAVLVNQLQQQTAANFELLDRFHKHFEAIKQRHRGVRFDDVTNKLLQLGETVDADEQNFRLDAEISHLLLDEFQDTSLRQWQIVRPLAERITHDEKMLFETAWSSFFCVGDVKQAIYGWRGGRSEIFDALEKQLEGIHSDELTSSYRSAPTIINLVNRVFENISKHGNLDSVEDAVEKFCDAFPTHTTTRDELKGFVQLETAPVADWDADWIPAGVQQEATFEYAAEKIKDLHELMPDRTIGVLLRTNVSVARIIYELRKKNVMASEEKGGNPLTDSAAVQVIMSLLKLSDHPDDRVAAFHVATSPIANVFGIDRSLDRKAILQLSRSIRDDLMHNGYGVTVSRLADQLKTFCNRRDRRRLQQLVELAFRFESNASLRASDFLLFVYSERIADPLVSKVRVMTIHQSKGLEFDVVVLPELESRIDDYSHHVVWDAPEPTDPIDRICIYRNQDIQQVLPPEMQKMFDSAKDREAVESLCLLYVAITRAAHALYMIISPAKKKSGKKDRTFAGLLHEALAPDAELEGQTVLYSDGTEEWALEQAVAKEEEVAPHVLPERIVLADSQQVLLDFKSPSQLEGGRQIAASELLRMPNRAALSKGTLIHGLFELVEWIDDLPEREKFHAVALALADTHVSPEQELKQFWRMLEEEEVAKLLSKDFYLNPFDENLIDVLPKSYNLDRIRLEVHNERSFVIPDEETMLSGTIDRLVLIYEGNQLVAADIVDYKTDRLDFGQPNEILERARHYQPQIDAYRRAVSKMFGLEQRQIGGRLLFVTGGIYHGFSAKSRNATT